MIVKNNIKMSIIAIVVISCVLIAENACGKSNNTESDAAMNTIDETESETIKYNIGETVTTDIADFTLNSVSLSYYASSKSDSYAEPIEENENGIFIASKGNVLVPLTFTIKNKDRTDINIGGSGDWGLGFKIVYSGNEYFVYGYDLNEKGGSGGLRLDFGVQSTDGGIKFEKGKSRNHYQEPGEVIYKTVGIARFDPQDLTVPFDIIINVPNSSGEYEYFTYSVN